MQLTNKRIERLHVQSFIKVFSPVLIFSPVVSRFFYVCFDGLSDIKYRDIYIFGFRIIRWQITARDES
jgi:hypothetical protein